MFYGSNFLIALIIDWKKGRIFKESAFPRFEYLFPKIKFPTTPANTGSEIEVSVSVSFSSGRPIKTGRRRIRFASSTSHCCFTPPPTRIAHSGSIPSRPTFLSSCDTK